jgi:hypothetical protein
MLQILLLAEKEVSAVARMNQQKASHLGLRSISTDEEILKRDSRPQSIRWLKRSKRSLQVTVPIEAMPASQRHSVCRSIPPYPISIDAN